MKGSKTPPTGGMASKIVRAAIHPAIGIARVGDSIDEYFLGPEVVDPDPKPVGFYKDKTGALKRQAAHFRIYGYDSAGNAVAELTSANAEINWTVHVANNKAAWYQFQIALDIPEASLQPPSVAQTGLRNAEYYGAARGKLSIDGGAIRIGGCDEAGAKYRFDQGRFLGKQVYLGELRTDSAGRLIFLGGHGVSASRNGSPVTTFANNDGWHDDVADGPVTASVTVAGKEIPCEGAWVVSAPPNFAPDIVGVRNMFDLLESLFVEGCWTPQPATVSFRDDILPILKRLSRLQWVNEGFAVGFGWDSPHNFEDTDLLAKLSQKPKGKALPGESPGEFGELRRQIANSFRVYSRDAMSPIPWPWIYGDAMSLPPISPRQYSTLTALQMQRLARWVAGDFVDDFRDSPPRPGVIGEVPLGRQPAMLDRAALTFCLADVFHPGCEITWPIRHLSMFSSPFRIKHQAPGVPPAEFGLTLTPEAALGLDGPLHAQAPGGLTRWMAVPWQADSASCQCGYDQQYDPRAPTFWAARVPNSVLTEDDYRIAINPKNTPRARMKAFKNRTVWMRGMSRDWQTSMNQMVASFGTRGVVETRANPVVDGLLPAVMLVESKPRPIPPLPAVLGTAKASAASQPAISAKGMHPIPLDKIHRIRL